VITPPPGTAVLPAVAEAGTPPLGIPVAAPGAAGPTPPPPRAGRPRWGGGVLLGFLAALVVLLIVAAIVLGGRTPGPFAPLTPSPSSGETVAVPNILGQKEGDAKKALEAAGLQVGDINQVDGPDGIVVNTTPLPGQSVAPGTPVSLYVGSTPTARSPKPKHSGKGKGGNGD
jgi:beta-lactam-binding protein with PASTA domain